MRRAAVAAVLMVILGTVAQAQRPAPAEQYAAPLGSAGLPPPGASSCSACHPATATIDTSAGRLIGQPAAEIASAMLAFRSGQRSGTIMDRIAKGFTDDEIKAIADWYGAQK